MYIEKIGVNCCYLPRSGACVHSTDECTYQAVKGMVQIRTISGCPKCPSLLHLPLQSKIALQALMKHRHNV